MSLQMLYVHWKAVRVGLVPFIVAAFGLPLLVAQELAFASNLAITTSGAVALGDASDFVALFPIAASGVGIILALSAWNWDHKGNHVYALSLPVSRYRYSFLKFGAGALLMLLPVAALLAGSLVAMAAVELPLGLQAYPLQLAGRFLATSLVLYAIFFALASGTIRTTSIVLSVLIGVPFLLSLTASSLTALVPTIAQIDVEYWVLTAVEAGPLRVLFGNWMLFDV